MKAVKVQNLGIHYRIYYRQARSLKTVAIDMLRSRYSYSQFWGLRDVSFNVDKGGMLGVVGRNGSGKSSLLKVLSGIYNPDEGKYEIKGRISALIELGAGFHPELTGRENIILNGAILGYSREEMAVKFDDIVSFSGVGKFIDSPVKNFSSGMELRLGFSVAVHSEPDVMLIDEVLAVGDKQFKKKCYKKIEEFRDKGVTILFVSHNMDEIIRYCDKCLWLDKGNVRAIGDPVKISKEYEKWLLKAEKDL
jgi:ABC-type polysaccharide/polyol phosphate transport system ATPase subunit